MKSILSILIFICSGLLLAQAPQMFKYQAAVRDGAGNLLSSTSVSFRISILDGSGTTMYSETHTVTTSSRGLVNLDIGGGNCSIG